MVWFFNAAYTPSGVLFNDYSYSVATIGMMSSAAVMNETLKVDGITLVKIKINNESYYVSEAVFEINKSKVENTTLVKLYQDLPAIKVGMRGARLWRQQPKPPLSLIRPRLLILCPPPRL